MKNPTHRQVPAVGEWDALCHEHGVALRMWGRMQNEVSQLVRSQQAERAKWHTELMRLRAALMITRTAVWWGMGLGGASPARGGRGHGKVSAVRPDPPKRTQSDEVLCDTACVGHAHHWLDDSLMCARSGQACHRVAARD